MAVQPPVSGWPEGEGEGVAAPDAGGLVPLFVNPVLSDKPRRRRPSRDSRPLLGFRTRSRLLWAQCRALLRNRRDSGPMVLTTLFNAAVTLALYVYHLTAPPSEGCPLRTFPFRAGVPHGCESVFHITTAISYIRVIVGSACLAGVWMQRVCHVQARLKQAKRRPVLVGGGGGGDASADAVELACGSGREGNPLSSWRGAHNSGLAPLRDRADGGQVPQYQSLSNRRVWGGGTSGWAVASSKQSWLEATDAMYSSVTLLVGTTLAVTLLLALSNVITALTDSGWTAGASWDYACRTCSDHVPGGATREAVVAECVATGRATLNMCFLSWHGRVVLPVLVGGQVLSLGLLTCFTLQAAWDPVAVEASNAVGQNWLRRWRVTHVVMAPCMTFVGFPILGGQAIEYYWASRATVEAIGCINLTLGIIQLAACVWVLQKGSHDSGPSSATADGADDDPLRRRRRRPAASLRRLASLPKVAYNAFLHDSVSLHFTHIFMLTLMIHSYSYPEMCAYGTATTITVLLQRALWVAIFVLARDTPADFSDLRHDPNGAGFGLVVDACMLQDALRRYLQNISPLPHLPTYKATVYRMEACMAVSYRWQGTESFVCPGLKLNMSRWQMEELLHALTDTSCFYVWIDRISVPQFESELQNTLLSRMMATYANARETLVLRSMEESGSRYHERAWTLPEFVCSLAPRVCTETTGERAGECGGRQEYGLASVAVREEEQVAAVREYYVRNAAKFKPMWLHSEGELQFSYNVVEAWDLYARIRGGLNCSIPEDRIRAVYPLLFGVPVDNHDELAHLVDSVANALQQQSPGSEAAVRARRHFDEIMGATVVDPAEEMVELDGSRPQRGVIGRAFASAANVFAGTSLRITSVFGSAFGSARPAAVQPRPASNFNDSDSKADGGQDSSTRGGELVSARRQFSNPSSFVHPPLSDFVLRSPSHRNQ